MDSPLLKQACPFTKHKTLILFKKLDNYSLGMSQARAFLSVQPNFILRKFRMRFHKKGETSREFKGNQCTEERERAEGRPQHTFTIIPHLHWQELDVSNIAEIETLLLYKHYWKKLEALLNKTIKVQLSPTISTIISGNQKLKDRRWHHIPKTIESISQFCCINFPTPISVKPFKRGLQNSLIEIH